MRPFKAVRSLRVRYVIGLSVIALFISASYLTLQRVVSEQRNFAKLVNLASHQSGLSNRIAYFASLMATTRDETGFAMAKAQVGRSINKMVRSHQVLRHGAPEEEIPLVTSESLKLIYDDSMVGLDLALERYLGHARAVYDTPMEALDTGTYDYIYLTTYGPHVLEPMFDAAVEEYEKIGRSAILRIENLELGIWIASLLTLLLVVIFIFRPLEARIRRTIGSLQATVAELEGTRERLLAAQRLALVGDWQWDVENDRFAWSEQVYRICGATPHSFMPTPTYALSIVHPEDRDGVMQALAHVRDTGHPVTFEHRVVHGDGTQRLVYQHAVRQQGPDGRPRIVGTMQDITERRELSSRLDKLSRNVPGFIYQYQLRADGSSCFPYASQGIEDVYGLAPEEVVEDAEPVFSLLHGDDVGRVRQGIHESARAQTTWTDKYRVMHSRKGEIWVEGHATPQRLHDGSTMWHGYIWDITDRKRSEDRIRELALFDPLTGLANRRLIKDRLEHALAAARRSEGAGAVLMLDLDNFKTLNDTQGHDAGDALLVEVGRRLRATVRESDTIGRLGGDEFVGILEGLGNTEDEAREKAAEVAEKIRGALAQAYVLTGGGQRYHVSVSLGVALFQGPGDGVDELLKQADVAMFEAKEAGRNCFRFFSEERQATINSRTSMVSALRRALEQGELTLHYQPQVSPAGEMVGAEALLRWITPAGDTVSPGEFIPVAEETGLILPVGEWVFEQACRHVRELEARHPGRVLPIAVNISPRQFSDDEFLPKVRDAIHRHHVNVGRLKLELTETSLVQDLARAESIVSELRAMGLRIELDDFGTGYSSLTSLKNLPLDTLKLDGTLVRDVGRTVSGVAIVRAAIAMADALSLKVVAEGVETPGQRDFLVAEGCDVLQGFLFARPMPFADLMDALGAEGETAPAPVPPRRIAN